MTVQSRPYQDDLERGTYEGWAANQHVLNVLSTGGGKSVVMSKIALNLYQQSAMQCIIAHRNELVAQMSSHVARMGIPHRIVGSDTTQAQIRRQHRTLFNGECFVHPTARTSVVGVDTLIARRETLGKWAHQHDRWMMDECFPAGTLITTLKGQEPIESLKLGDEVLAFNEKTNGFEYKKITHLFKNPKPYNMVRLTTSTHHVIETTYGHPFWTQRGWVEAGDLKNDDSLSVFNVRSTRANVRILPERTLSKYWPCLLWKSLFKRVSSSSLIGNNEKNESEIRIRKDEEKQPNEVRELSKKNVGNFEANQTQTYAGRKWKNNSCSGTNTDRQSQNIRVHTTICNQDKNATRFRLSDLLQAKYGSSESQNSDRGGWFQSLLTFKKRNRSEKRFFSKFVRLESIEILQSGNNYKDECSHVYNIEVDDLNTYIANEIVVHNCHHTLTANKWGKAVSMMPNALGAGFTATPVRADGQGLGVKELGGDGVFHRMNLGPSMRWLIDNHFLSDFEIVCPKSDMRIEDEGNVSADGDWSHQKLKKAAKKSHIVGDVVENYCKYAYGRQAIVFATDVETGADMAAKFIANGIKAAFLSAETPTAVREKYITEFKSQKIQVLINVDLFDEGFDVPSCDVVMMARPTASLGKYRQMAGRALRYQVGKIALIIDMVSNVIRHGLPDKEIAWSLARRDKRGKQMRDPEEIPLTTCINCTKPYEKFMVACPYCGSEKPLPEPRSRSIEMVEGDLILLDRETLAKMRASTVMENPADISARVAMAAGSIAGMGAFNRQKEKCEAHEALKETIAQWAGIQRARGFSDREIQRKFYYALGMDVVTALDATRPRSEIESIDKTIQAWWRK